MKTSALLFLGLSAFAALPAGATTFATGKIVLPKSLLGAAAGIHTIFVSVYDASKKNGPAMPYGAVKIDLPADAKAGDVTTFTLDSETMTMMTASEKLPSKLDIKAKLDKDGSAGPDGAGDVIGWKKGVKPGTKGVVVTLEKVAS
jgi:hypothetical protein